MPTLILVRHAKSDWGDASLRDHDRPLNKRGQRDAPAMAAMLAGSGVSVDRLLSSTALRARTTAAEFASALEIEAELDAELYLADADTLLTKAATTGADTVMVVAHDPGLSDLAYRLSGGTIEHMPTCAVAQFEWDSATWAEAMGRVADRHAFHTPRGTSA